MTDTIPVENIFLNPSMYHNKVISVHGQFIAIHYGLFLCPLGAKLKVDPDPVAPKIELDHPDLEQRCFDAVSPWVGGPWSYLDPATVRGRFVAHPVPKLTELTILAINRRGTDYYVGLT